MNAAVTYTKPTQRYTRRSTDGNNIGNIKSRFRIARLYVSISILLSIFSILFEPTAIHVRALMTGQQLPLPLFYAAIGVSIIALLDSFINDILPNKYQFKPAYQYRHLVYMGLALISFSLSAALLITYGGSILVGRLWLDGAIATAIAILDIFARHRKNSWR